ncbi:MAG: acetyl-CoA carboxylase biotin carboxyl carrier protein [Rhizobiaceae bacterium]|nr:acetyl-CoA carboxylase biotin carboxyl carrier protein [Hyphomicrobiales bacterium]NRB31897.1 acetyl-CoA carboxylase biotin carboxyl carrier protein [Rhizobiaceae bacterium]
MAAKKSSIDTKMIRELAVLLNETDLNEIELEEGEMRLRLSRGATAVAAPAVTHAVVAPPATAPAPAAPAPAAPAAAPAAAEAAAPSASGTPITSPMVGTAYLAPSPNANPFVKVGDKVTAGQTIMIVEAMKTMNQISATQDGVVASIEVDDGQPVEFGETLITLA